MLALVGAYPVSSPFTSYYVRPDVTDVPLRDAVPHRRRFRWRPAHDTATIRAFDRVAVGVTEETDDGA